MNRREFLNGLLSTTAAVAVGPLVPYASGGIVTGIDFADGPSRTVMSFKAAGSEVWKHIGVCQSFTFTPDHKANFNVD